MAITNVNSGDVITAAKMNTKLEAPVAASELAAGVVRCVIAGNNNAVGMGAGQTVYLGFFNNSGSASEGLVEIALPYGGMLRNLRVVTSTAQPASGALTLTMRRNGADTALSLQVAAGAPAGVYADTINSVGVSPGDRICLKALNAAAATSAGICAFTLEVAV